MKLLNIDADQTSSKAMLGLNSNAKSNAKSTLGAMLGAKNTKIILREMVEPEINAKSILGAIIEAKNNA